jgi:phytoene dehydrogenase-like protein
MQQELAGFGLDYLFEEDHITGHPHSDGPGIVIYRDVNKTCESIAQYSSKDATRYREIFDDWSLIRDGFVRTMFSPPNPPSFSPAAFEQSVEGLNRMREFNLSSRAFVHEKFENNFVRASILGWALAPQIFPDTECAGQSFYVLIPGIHTYGSAIPRGGSQMMPNALARLIEAHGGSVITGLAVDQFIVNSGECKGLRFVDGTEMLAKRAVVTGLGPKVSFLDCCKSIDLPTDFIDACRRFSYGRVSICRAHYALNEAPRWKNGEEMSACAFQRIFHSVSDIDRQYGEIIAGLAPTRPFLWVACWTTIDPSRAPPGKHTLIIDTFVPSHLRSGKSWDAEKESYTREVMLPILREHTENMQDDNILAAYYDTGVSLEAANPCFVDGNTTGGERTLSQMGYFRPLPGYSQYKSPLRNLYMTGPSCHPGGGITAMGTITARVILDELGALPNGDAFSFPEN